MKYRYMHTIKIFIAPMALVFILNSCNDFLDRSKLGEETTDNYFNSESKAIASLTAAYSDMTDYRLNWSDWAFGETLSDNAIYSGSDGDANGFEPLKNFNGTSAMSLVVNRWRIAYRGINKSSQTIEGVEKMDDDLFTTPGLKARLIGEAQFLRAYYHFELVRSYGRVPIVNHLIIDPTERIQQSEIADVYEFIIAELQKAEQVLPTKGNYAGSDLGRITKGAAQSFIAKSYFEQGNWIECKKWCDQVIASGEYSLGNDFAFLFSLAGEHGVESILEISMYNSATETGALNNNGNFQTLFQLPRNITYGYGINQPTQDLCDAFITEGDSVRKKATLLTTDEVYHMELAKEYQDSIDAALSGDPELIAEANEALEEGKSRLINNRTGFYNRKMYLSPSERSSQIRNNPNNIRIMRYAEILLMDAEANYQLGNESEALSLLNELRTTRSLGSKTVAGSDLLEAIYIERRLELAMENDRYYELIRTNRAGMLPNWTEGRKYWPVPQQEIDMSTGEISQNPGYN